MAKKIQYGMLWKDIGMRAETWEFSEAGRFQDRALIEVLNELGEEGWELVSAIGGKGEYIMKRKI